VAGLLVPLIKSMGMIPGVIFELDTEYYSLYVHG
jgi:hypothetical protein